MFPQDFLESNNWVYWKAVPRKRKDGTIKIDKVPYRIRNHQMALGKHITWGCPYPQQVLSQFSGRGFVLNEKDRFLVVDIDKSESKEELDKLVSWSDTFVEFGPSEKIDSLHIWFRLSGKFNTPGNKKKKNNTSKLDWEVYSDKRFFTMTGARLSDKPLRTLSDKEVPELFSLLKVNIVEEEKVKEKTKQSQEVFASDSIILQDQEILDILKHARNSEKFQKLFSGNIQGYDSSSNADQTLMCILTFYSRNREQLARLFSFSQLAKREKWNRLDYQQRTISAALAQVKKTYTVKQQAKKKEVKKTYKLAQEAPKKITRKMLPFPLQVLPTWLQEWATNLSSSMGSPIDYFLCTALAVAANALGKTKVLVKPSSNWFEAPNFWFALVGGTGYKKTPAIQAALKPLNKISIEIYKQAKENRKAYKKELKIWNSSNKKTRGEGPDEPEKSQTVVTTDATTESLGPVLERSPSVLLSMDELSGWIGSMNQYRGGQGKDKEFYLSAWSGTFINVTRKHQDDIQVVNPCLNVVGGLVPDSLPKFKNFSTNADGFLERILFCCPDQVQAKWNNIETRPQQEKYEQEILRIWKQYREKKDNEDKEVNYIKMTTEGQELFAKYYNLIQKRKEANENTFEGKLIIQCARIALVLCALRDEKEISLECMKAAYTIAEYFCIHNTHANISAEISEEFSEVEKVYTWLKKKKIKDVTPRYLVRSRRAKNIKHAKEILQEMQDLEFIL